MPVEHCWQFVPGRLRSRAERRRLRSRHEAGNWQNCARAWFDTFSLGCGYAQRDRTGQEEGGSARTFSARRTPARVEQETVSQVGGDCNIVNDSWGVAMQEVIQPRVS